MVWRQIVQSWLTNAARQTVQQKVMQAAGEQVRAALNEPHSAPESAAPERPPIGCVFALGVEAGGLEDLLHGVTASRGDGFSVRQGMLHDRRMLLFLAGAGGRKAARATEALLTGHRPDYVISAGFAGGLDAKLHRRDLMVADRLVDANGNQRLLPLPAPVASLAESYRAHIGTLLTVDHVVRTPAEKRSLGSRHAALAVDMETFAVAEVCLRHEVPLLCVRIVYDAIDDHVSREVENLLAQKSSAGQWGAALGAIINRPSAVKDLLKLKEDALLNADRLAKFVAEIVRLA